MKIYKIGIIGCGGIAQKMAATLEKMKGVERYAVASRNQEKAEAFANKWEFTKAYGSYEELASDPEVDLIYIATPHAMHYDNAHMCIEKGKPVLCEKLLPPTSVRLKISLLSPKKKEYSLPKLYGPGICPFHLKYKNC